MYYIKQDHNHPDAEGQFDCTKCNSKVHFITTRKISNPSELRRLFEGEINRIYCRKCGYIDYFECPVLLEGICASGGPWSEIVSEGDWIFSNHLLTKQLIGRGWTGAVQYIPLEMLEQSDILNWLLWNREHLTVVHSMDELVRQAHARARLYGYLREINLRFPLKVSIRDLEIPRGAFRRMKGRYRKGKLKICWFIANCFEEGQVYPAEHVCDMIAAALSRIDVRIKGCATVSEVFDALQTLELLVSTKSDRHFWRNADLVK